MRRELADALFREERLTLAQASRLVVSLGITAGVAACVIAGPFLAHLLYGVSPRDPLAITGGPAVLIVVAALAISLPARRAMKQNPIVAPRAE